jgi:hypothetical protein
MLRAALLAFLLSLGTIWAIAADEPQSDYFPQHSGNEWVYRKTGRLAGENAGWTNKITDKVGTSYRHNNFFGDNVPHIVRVNKRGTILEKDKDNRYVWYKFANTGQWTLNLATEGSPCINDSRVKVVSTTETVQVPAGTFRNCIKLVFETNCMDAGISEQWFAPGVGLIKQTEESIGGIITSELIRAQINTISYPAK